VSRQERLAAEEDGVERSEKSGLAASNCLQSRVFRRFVMSGRLLNDVITFRCRHATIQTMTQSSLF
jgi:hypothetical protein